MKFLQYLTLNVGMNVISDQGFENFEVFANENCGLKELKIFMHDNMVNDDGVQMMCKGLKNLQYLKSIMLDVSRNSFKKEGLSYINECVKFFNEKCLINSIRN